jgi:3',5'-cyclic AMP phosphodiesterase CpdA
VRPLLFLALAAQLFAAEKVKPDVLHRPSPIPDRIILTWSADPSTTQAVTWRTDKTVAEACAEIAPSTAGPQFLKLAQRIAARTEALKSESYEAFYHAVEFTGLQPDTPYLYRVGDGANWSEWNQFRTASADPRAPLEFIYVGDAQNDIWAMWSRVIRQSLLDAPRARFIVHAGDLVNRSARDEEWGEWFMAPGWIIRSIPSLPTPGNHEYPSKGTLNANWKPQFTLPGNGVPGLEETNYYIDIHGLRLISLNSNEKQDEQAAWLDQLLAANPHPWVICAFHHPIFSTARGRDNKKLRETWQPVFDRHAVDMVLTGHDHTYGRTNVMSGAPPVKSKSGTVYVVSVSGPKMYRHDKARVHVRVAEDTQLFQVIRIAGDRLSYEARTAAGELFDAFDLVKQKNRPNRLVPKPGLSPASPRGPAVSPAPISQ